MNTRLTNTDTMVKSWGSAFVFRLIDHVHALSLIVTLMFGDDCCPGDWGTLMIDGICIPGYQTGCCCAGMVDQAFDADVGAGDVCCEVLDERSGGGAELCPKLAHRLLRSMVGCGGIEDR